MFSEYLTEGCSPATRPYSPNNAVLYTRTIGSPGDLEALGWPLDPALLNAPVDERYRIRVVGRGEGETREALPKQSMGLLHFRLGDRIREAILVLRLPGADGKAVLASGDLLSPEPAPKE